MDREKIAHLTHEARLMIAEEYRLGQRRVPLDATMVRLIIQSLHEEHEREIALRTGEISS